MQSIFNMTINWDWVLWILGGAIAIAGLALLYWAMLGDRWGFPLLARASGRRRRCPRCWYDMSASAGLVCSECGRHIKRERSMFKVRRRWGLAFLSLLILVLAAGTAMTPSIRRDGWARHVPTTILIALTPKHLDATGSVELIRRLHEDRLWTWQWSWLINRSNSKSAPLWKLSVTTNDRWPEHVPLCADVTFDFNAMAAWFEETSVRARLLPTFDPSATPIELETSSLWWYLSQSTTIYERAKRLGIPPAGAHEVQLDFVIETIDDGPPRRRGSSNVRWRVIHRETVRVPVVVGGKLEEFIAPDSSVDLTSAIQKNTRFELTNGYLAIEDRALQQLRPGLTCPVTVELLKNGNLVTSWPDWLMTGTGMVSVPRTNPYNLTHWLGLPSSLKGDDRPFGTVHYADFTWSLRVHGEPGLALLDKNANTCWAGEFDVPLHLMDKPNELVLRSWDDHDEKAKDEQGEQHN